MDSAVERQSKSSTDTALVFLLLIQLQLAVGFLFGLAALTCAGRIIIRLRTKGRLVLDDCLILFAFLNLIGGTVVVYDQVHNLYLEWAATRGDIVVTLMALRNMENFFEMSKWRVAYFFFLWTTIFSVKMAYFAFFRPFLRAMGRAIDYYYWFAVGITVVSWILLAMGDAVIVCPHVGKAASELFIMRPCCTVTNKTCSTMRTELVSYQPACQRRTLVECRPRCLH